MSEKELDIRWLHIHPLDETREGGIVENAATRLALRKATRLMVAARQEELRIHPSPDDLAAYHAKALTPQQSEHVQDHISFCPDCSHIVMQLAPEIGAGQQCPPISDQHVSQAWDQFVESLLSPSEPAEPPQAASPAGSARSSSLAALAALLIAAVGVASFSIWILKSLPEPQATSVIYLQALEERERSWERNMARIRPQDEVLVVVLQPMSALDRSSSYGVSIERAESQDPVWRKENLRPDERSEFPLVFQRDSLPPGQYRLHLFEHSNGHQTRLGTYSLSIDAPTQ